jgi:GDP-L-fucose synthase
LNKNIKIFLAGHNGLVGSAILRKLTLLGYKRVFTRAKKNLDLRDQNKVFSYIKSIKPDIVLIAAATVGGIHANNKYRSEFIYNNLSIQNNIIHGSFLAGVKNLIFLGSSCVYPKHSEQPIKEHYLLNGKLEYTNEPYAIAKIAGIKMCENYNLQYNLNYKSLMPCNTYGPGDNYNPDTSHFFPSLINKIYNGRLKKLSSITLWGDGTPKRELLYVDDLADACIFFMSKKTKETLINIGSGKDFSIKYYAELILKWLDYKAKIKFDSSKPNGTKRKLLDTSVAKRYGWKVKIDLKTGFFRTLDDFIKNRK